MTPAADLERLRQALWRCGRHRQALGHALADLALAPLTGPADLENPGRERERLLDQFTYRFIRLQDDLGQSLMPAILRCLGEDVPRLAMLARLDRLEQLGWLEQAERWLELRQIRNALTHDYPEPLEQQWQDLQAAIAAAHELVQLFDRLVVRIRSEGWEEAVPAR